jgi:hypothetical protein
MDEKPRYWLDQEGFYWVDAVAHPDRAEARRLVEEGESVSVRDNGRGVELLRDCPVDHMCFDPSRVHNATDVWDGCDYHEHCPCPPERQIDAWRFVDAEGTSRA